MKTTPTIAVRALVAVVFCALVVPLSSCETLLQVAEEIEQNQADVIEAVKPILPTVTYEEAVLVRSPSKTQMAAYYCPIVVPDPFGVPGSAAVACEVAFGAPPTQDQMTVGFELRFKVKNENKFPVPVAELLTAATVFPAKTNQNLGAACIAFCGKEQPDCDGKPKPDSCQSKQTDIKSMDDFKQAAVNVLIAKGIEYIEKGKVTFKAPEVVQDEEITIKARFEFGPTALLGVLKEVANQAVDQLKAGKDVEFRIPYRLEGTVWVDLGEFGRAAVGYGPASGEWIIPTEAIIP